MNQTRRLAAILAADVAGYSRLMGADEEGTLERLKALRGELIDPKNRRAPWSHRQDDRRQRAKFASVVDAVRCAVEVQQAMPERNASVAADSRIEWRIGINLGDVIVEGRRPLRRPVTASTDAHPLSRTHSDFKRGLFIWPTAGGRGDGVNQTRDLAAILIRKS